MPPRAAGWGSWRRGATWPSRSPRQLFFGSLPNAGAYLVLGLFFLCWLIGFSGFSSLGQGNPSGGTPGCPWRLNDHGSFTCVSYERFEQVSVAAQRSVAGLFMGFFVIHLGVAADDIVRRRRS